MILGCRKCGRWMGTRKLAVHEPDCEGGKRRPNLNVKSHTLSEKS